MRKAGFNVVREYLVAVCAACLPLAACGTARVAGVPSPSPAATTASATPTPARPLLVAVLDRPFGAAQNSLTLLGTDGTAVARAPFRDDAEAVVAAGSQLLIAGGGRLQAMDRSGVLIDLGPLPDNGRDQLIRGLVASPSGDRWMWASVHQDPDGLVHSRLWEAGITQSPRLVRDQSEPGHALQPVAWTPGGVVVGDEPVGIGGYVLFRRNFGATSLLDPSSGALSPLSSDACAFSDLAADGTLACVLNGHEAPRGAGPVTLRITGGPRRGFDVALPASVAQAGAAYFGPAGQVSLGSSPIRGEGSEQVECDTVDLSSHARHAIAAPGLIPVAWLRGGALLTTRLTGTTGGPPGAFVVSPQTGATRAIGQSPTVVGVLD